MFKLHDFDYNLIDRLNYPFILTAIGDFILDPLILAHFASCLMMTGLIWLVQLVHYPAFFYVEEARFTNFEGFHATRISFIVLPLMCIELGTGIWMLANDLSVFLALNLALLGLIWISTFLLSIPCHSKLGQKKDDAVIQRLVATNWPRTALWTFRSIMLFVWLL